MLVPSPRVLCLGWWEVSHWQLVLTAPAAPAKSLRHLRGGAAISCSPPLSHLPWQGLYEGSPSL